MVLCKRIKAFFLVFLLIFLGLLSGCSVPAFLGGVSVQDAENYVSGEIEAVYRNHYTKEYLDILGQDQEELEPFYTQNLAMESKYLLDYLVAEYPDDETTKRAEKLMEKIYQNVKYEIVGGEKLDGGDFAVTVVIYPIVLLEFLVSDYLDDVWENVIKEENIDWENMTDYKYEVLNKKLDNIYTNLLLDAVEMNMDSLTHGIGQEVVVHLISTGEGYTLDSADWYKLDNLIIDYFGSYPKSE